jgi:hypothetical protein
LAAPGSTLNERVTDPQQRFAVLQDLVLNRF